MIEVIFIADANFSSKLVKKAINFCKKSLPVAGCYEKGKSLFMVT